MKGSKDDADDDDQRNTWGNYNTNLPNLFNGHGNIREEVKHEMKRPGTEPRPAEWRRNVKLQHIGGEWKQL